MVGDTPTLLLSLSMLLKVDRKISVSFRLVGNFKVLDLAMAKVKKVNFAVTYSHPSLMFQRKVVAFLNEALKVGFFFYSQILDKVKSVFT
jgi:hypothetical protein